MAQLKIYKIEDRMYPTFLRLVVGTHDQFAEYTKKNYGIILEHKAADAAYYAYELHGEIHRFIWICEYDHTIYQMGLLAHEVYHLTKNRLKDLGIVYCKESEEAFAYYLQHIFQQCLKALFKKKIERKRSGRKSKRT